MTVVRQYDIKLNDILIFIYLFHVKKRAYHCTMHAPHRSLPDQICTIFWNGGWNARLALYLYKALCTQDSGCRHATTAAVNIGLRCVNMLRSCEGHGEMRSLGREILRLNWRSLGAEFNFKSSESTSELRVQRSFEIRFKWRERWAKRSYLIAHQGHMINNKTKQNKARQNKQEKICKCSAWF